MSYCLQRTCNKCDMGYILKDYIHPTMQLLTNDIKAYNMSLLTTKCLNTAVMLMYFMVGNRGIQLADRCDCSKFRETSLKAAIDDDSQNARTVRSLAKSILRKSALKRELFYILLTDANFATNSGDVYFPGHVIVIEKIPPVETTQNQISYNVYQSYIYEYDLKGHHKFNNDTFTVSYDNMRSLLKDLAYVMTSEKWDDKCIEAWKHITFVDTSNLKNAHCKNRFFICYQHTKARDCIERMERFAKKHLKTLEKTHVRYKDVYGDANLYNGDVKPLTKYEMKLKLENMVNDIIKFKEGI